MSSRFAGFIGWLGRHGIVSAALLLVVSLTGCGGEGARTELLKSCMVEQTSIMESIATDVDASKTKAEIDAKHAPRIAALDEKAKGLGKMRSDDMSKVAGELSKQTKLTERIVLNSRNGMPETPFFGDFDDFKAE